MRVVLFVVIILSGTLFSGCRPQACYDAYPIIEEVSAALDEGRYDAASSGLASLEEMLSDETGFLTGFSKFSGGLHEALDKLHRLETLPAEEADFAERRLPTLIEGWQREATAVKRRCGSYLL